MKTPTKILAFSVISLSLTGCFFGAAVSVAESAKTMSQERTVGGRIDDNAIALKINDRFAQRDFDNIFTNVSTRIVEGRVMLTGAVKSESEKQQAEDLTWQVSGVKEVINEIQVATNNLESYSTDVWLSKTVRTKLIITKTIHSTNFEVDAVNGTVYILGIAQNETERRNVAEIARRVKGVREVASHVILKDDPRRGVYAGRVDAQ